MQPFFKSQLLLEIYVKMTLGLQLYLGLQRLYSYK